MKIKKLLAGFVSAAMIMGTMMLPTFADGEGATGTPGPVTVSGVSIAEGMTYDTIQEAYNEIKDELVAKAGLGEEALSEEDFNAFFTDGGKITWTISGEQKVTDPRMFSFGRAANRFGEGRLITEINIVGDENAVLDLSDVNGTFALPYNWWNVADSTNTALKCKNITFNGIKSMPSATYQCVLYPTTYEFDGCTFNGNLYSYQNFDVDMTIKNSTFNAPDDKTQYAFMSQGLGGTITLDNNKIYGYTRGINLQRETADFIVTKNTIESNVSEPDRGAVQITDGKSFVVTGNTIDVNGGNAFWFHSAANNSNATYTISENNIKAPYLANDDTTFGVNDKITAVGNIYNDTDTKKCMEKEATEAIESTVTALQSVAKIGDKEYVSLADAVKAAKDNDTIIIFGTVENAQKYLPADKTVTFKGAEEKTVLKFSGAVALHQNAEKTLTFDGLTMEWPNANYNGIQHSVNLVYKNVTVTGMPFLYAVNETFENCKFVQTDSNAYNVWTYGAENVVFKECEFQSAGKSVLIYNEGTLKNGKIDVQGCKFNASSPVEGKAAIEIDSTSSNYKLSIDKKTTATGFGTGSTSGNSLYNVKKYKIEKQADNTFKSNVTISVGGKEVTAVPLNAKVIDKIKTTGATIELKDLHKNDKINLADDSTYELVVKTAPKAEAEKANAAIKEAADANPSKLILDVYVQKTDSNGNESKVDVRGQNIIYTLDETVAEGSAVNVYHVDADGNASKVANVKRDGQTIEFTADSFSTYAVTYTADSLTEAEISENVGVVFSKVEGTDNEYNIVLKALDGKKINRFMVARLAFKNACGTVDYEITPAANMTASLESTNAQSREYRFNMDGTNASGATGDAITIGKIVFEGYGALDFSVDTSYVAAGAINVVETAKDADNIVTSYSAADGTLTVNMDSAPEKGKITDTIELEKKTLTVNIDFNNRVEKNAAAYQNMKVVISGGDLAQDEVIALGEDNFTDDSEKTSYSVSKELTVNTAYTVTVSGAGYRTARYTVTMTGDKVLNFWNNAKDADTVVEEGNAASARKVTFLAGDIVKDNNINVYDLSAVVSYFGTKVNKDTQAEYAKYDLNRDGVIDSKDVAYVLVSWGK